MKILADSKECNADAIVTTEKDAVKIQQFLYIFPRGQDCAGRARNKLGG